MKTVINTGVVRVCAKCNSDLFTISNRYEHKKSVKVFECMQCGSYETKVYKKSDDRVADATRYTMRRADSVEEKLFSWATLFDKYAQGKQQGVL